MSDTFTYPEKNNKNKINPDWQINNCYSHELNGLVNKYKKKGKQSPININTKNIQQCNLLCSLSINYKPSKCNIIKNKQNIIILKWDENSYITYNNKQLPLKYVYFHTPSHHLIDDNNSVMEINLYHSFSDEYLPVLDEKIKNNIEDTIELEHPNVDNKKKEVIKDKGVIISILVKIGDSHSSSKQNNFFSQFITNPKFLGMGIEDKVNIYVDKKWNINDLLPNKKSFYSYEGSLPMPPCYESFNWIIFEEPIDILSEYIDIFKTEGNPNGFRNAHPLNDRVILYNNSVEIKEDDKNEYNEITKKDLINKMIAPIRITVDSRSGVDYRINSKKIIDSYSHGANKDYKTNQKHLETLSSAWNELGKSGEQDLSVTEILDLNNENQEKYYDYVKNMIFDARKFNYYNYFDIYLSFYDSKFKSDPNYLNIIELATSELSNLNSKSTFTKDGNFTFEEINKNLDNFKGKNIDKIKKNIPDILAILLLLNWNMDNYNNPKFVNLLSLIEDKEELFLINNYILLSFKKSFEGQDLGDIIFKFQGEDLTYTLNGDECQTLGSNEVHYEGNLLSFFKKNLRLDKKGYKYEDMDYNLKDLARDGILNKSIDNKWKPHNKCRDPKGIRGAPWCYTKNPKVRWEYCMIPDKVGDIKKYLLLLVFIMILFLSIMLVKTIFKYELFSKAIASATGSNFVTEAVFKTNQIASNIKANMK